MLEPKKMSLEEAREIASKATAPVSRSKGIKVDRMVYMALIAVATIIGGIIL